MKHELVLTHDPGEHRGWALLEDVPAPPTPMWPTKRRCITFGLRYPKAFIRHPFIFVTETQWVAPQDKSGKQKRARPEDVLKLARRAGIAIGRVSEHPLCCGVYVLPVRVWKDAAMRGGSTLPKPATLERFRRQMTPAELHLLEMFDIANQPDLLDAYGMGQAVYRIADLSPYRLTGADGLGDAL